MINITIEITKSALVVKTDGKAKDGVYNNDVRQNNASHVLYFIGKMKLQH